MSFSNHSFQYTVLSSDPSHSLDFPIDSSRDFPIESSRGFLTEDQGITCIEDNGYDSYLSMAIPRKLTRKRSFMCCSKNRSIEYIKALIEHELGVGLVNFFTYYYLPDRIFSEVSDPDILRDMEYIKDLSPNLWNKDKIQVNLLDIRRIWKVVRFNEDNLLDDKIEDIVRKSTHIRLRLEGTGQSEKIKKYAGKNIIKVPLRYISKSLGYIRLLSCPRYSS
mgnify:CR=1 FL=1